MLQSLRLLYLTVCGFSLLAGPSTSLQAEDLRSAHFLDKARVGFDQIFNLDYDEAATTFEGLAAEYPEHPGPPLYMATTIWLQELFQRQDLELDKFISPGYFDQASGQSMATADKTRFHDLINRSQQLCEELLAASPGHRDARYFLGALQGVLGSFSITIERSKTGAFKHGKKAYRYHIDLIEEESSYYDAYMTAGVYEYVVGSLPWYLRFLAALAGYKGSKKRGFDYLSLAVEKGQFVSDNARTVQLVLLVREKRYEDALSSLHYLKSRSPKNFLAHLNEAQLLESLGRHAAAARLYREILSKAEDGRPHFDRIPLATFRYAAGQKLLKLGNVEAALDQFRKSLTDSETPERERTLSRLASGNTLDLLDRRSEAVEYYRSVLEQPNLDRSHKQARKYLKKPFSIPKSKFQTPN